MPSFFVPGVPQPKGSKRGYVMRRKGERGQAEGAKAFRAVLVEGGHSPQDAIKASWAAAVKAAAQAAAPKKPLDGPLGLAIVFYLPRPKTETRADRERIWHTVKPDSDKLLRAVCDPLKGVLIADDARICSTQVEKRYAPFGMPHLVGARVSVAPLAMQNPVDARVRETRNRDEEIVTLREPQFPTTGS